jgi:hypothetical protein
LIEQFQGGTAEREGWRTGLVIHDLQHCQELWKDVKAMKDRARFAF